jgi:ArsR family transcriptional regulator
MKHLPVLEQPCCTAGAPPLPKTTAEALALRFKALADPARVAIVNGIASADEACTCNFLEPLGLSQPTVSHHLRVLREAGLVEVARRQGTWTFYRLVPGAIEELAFALAGSPEPATAV